MSLQRLILDDYCSRQEGSPVAICVAADLKKLLTEDTPLLNHCVVKRMIGVVNIFFYFYFMKYPPLLPTPKTALRAKPVIFIGVCSFLKSLALMLHPQQMTADEIVLSTTHLQKICNILLHPLQDKNFPKNQSLLCPFL